MVQKPRPAENLEKYKYKILCFILSDDNFEIKSKIYSLNSLSCFYLYFELQDDYFSEFVSLYICNYSGCSKIEKLPKIKDDRYYTEFSLIALFHSSCSGITQYSGRCFVERCIGLPSPSVPPKSICHALILTVQTWFKYVYNGIDFVFIYTCKISLCSSKCFNRIKQLFDHAVKSRIL